MQHEVHIEGWSHLNEVLFDEPAHPELGRYRSNFAFRGVSSSNYDLSTTLMRLRGEYASLESHIIRGFQKYAHQELANERSIWNWLSLAQHHGLPTRLLDWTYSPFVAAHFATDQNFDQDGAIYRVNFSETNRRLPPHLRSVLGETKARVFTTVMLDEAVPTLSEFDKSKDSPSVVFFEPPSLDARIVNQYAMFSAMNDPKLAMDQWLEDDPSVFQKVVIPAELKWEIRDKLDQAGINERMLFPGLDGLCRYLTRYYSPTGEPIEDNSPDRQT